MSTKPERKASGMGQPVLILLGLTAVATLLSIGLALFGYMVAAAIIGTATVFLWLSLIIVTTAVVVSWWSAVLMERGANIALTATVSDDRRDVAMINSLTKMLGWWKESQPDQLPALPMQSQTDWLPQLNEYDVVNAELEEVE
jgi:hypothetical protein